MHRQRSLRWVTVASGVEMVRTNPCPGTPDGLATGLGEETALLPDTPMDCQAPVALWLIGNEGLDFVSSATMAEN